MPADPLVLCAFHASHADTHVHRHSGAHFHGFLCSCSHLSNTFHDGLPPVLPQTICHKCFPTQFYIGAVTHKILSCKLILVSRTLDIPHCLLAMSQCTTASCLVFHHQRSTFRASLTTLSIIVCFPHQKQLQAKTAQFSQQCSLRIHSLVNCMQHYMNIP